MLLFVTLICIHVLIVLLINPKLLINCFCFSLKCYLFDYFFLLIFKIIKQKVQKKKKMSATRAVPRWSPSQVLSSPDAA